MAPRKTAALGLLLAAAVTLALPARAGRSGYSVEAAAGVSSQGSSVNTSYGAASYTPFSDMSKSAPPTVPRVAPAGSAYQAAEDGQGGDPHPERDGIDPTAVPAKTGDEKPADEKPVELTLADARENFPAVVETFFRKESDDGVWTYRARGKPRRFTLISADAKRLKALGKGVYAGPALLRDAATRAPVVAEFVVDFSGTEWKVVGAKVAPPPGFAPGVAPAKAPAQR